MRERIHEPIVSPMDVNTAFSGESRDFPEKVFVLCEAARKEDILEMCSFLFQLFKWVMQRYQGLTVTVPEVSRRELI